MLKNLIFSYMATIGFSVLFNIPRKNIWQAGIVGASGWTVYKYLEIIQMNLVFAVFLGALIVGLLSEIFARVFKKPATIFQVPGIIPLVPGYSLYYTMLQIIDKSYIKATKEGSQALLIAVGIASGIIISSSIGNLVINKKHKKKSY